MRGSVVRKIAIVKIGLLRNAPFLARVLVGGLHAEVTFVRKTRHRPRITSNPEVI